MPPVAFEIDESTDALVRPGLMKVALYNAAFDVRARVVEICRSTARTVITFDRDVPQALIVDKLAAKMRGES